jgi:bifunctional non-homologous end joining protein LigD
MRRASTRHFRRVSLPEFCRGADLIRVSSTPALQRCKASRQVGDRWVSKIKFDGYRVQAHFAQGRAIMFTRGGYDWAQDFSSLAAALTALSVNGIVLDTEAIPQNEKGVAGFGLLQDDLAVTAA